MLSGKIFNRYEIVKRLGQGAQSTVYLVRDEDNDGALKAAKVLKLDATKDHAIGSLIREYQVLESLDHENLVRVFECRFHSQEKIPIVITEYLPGSDSLEAFLKDSAPLSFQNKLLLTDQMLAALRFLHLKKIIHGDLKPSNILLTPDHLRLKLIDFGVSSDLLLGEARKRVGTPYYIAPEALREGVEPASDLYSLGIILYRLFVSTDLPYRGRPVEEIFATLLSGRGLFDEKDFQAEHVPPALVEVIRSLLSFEPRERPRDLAQVQRELRFAFPAIFTDNPSLSLSDVRLREVIGPLKPSLEVARQMVLSATPRHLLFVGAPSGGGKTRYLQETTKICQTERLEHLSLRFRQHDFWVHAIQTIMLRYADHRETRIFGERLRQAISDGDSSSRQRLFSRYLRQLAKELGGLVLLIDGLGQDIPVSFLSILPRFGKCKPLTVIISVRLDSPTAAAGEEKLGEHLDSLHEAFTKSVKPIRLDPTTAESSTSADEQTAWLRFPKELRALGREGLAFLLGIEPWKAVDIGQALKRIFPNETFDGVQAERLRAKTHGNPGLLQALCQDVCHEDQIGEHLLQRSSEGSAHDLAVYRIERYAPLEKAALALIAALDPVALSDLSRIEVPEARPTTIKALDDGLVQREGEESFSVPNPNVRHYLQNLSRRHENAVSQILYGYLLRGPEALKPREILLLSAFLGERGPWARSMAQVYSEATSAKEKLWLLPFYEELKRLGLPRDYELRMRLKMLELELQYLQSRYEEAEHLAQEIQNDLREYNDAFSNGVRVRTNLILGLIYRIWYSFKKAIDHLREAVDSDLLSDKEHYFALGSLAICQLYRAKSDDERDEAFSVLKEARAILKEKDAVSYGAVTNYLAGYLIDHGEFGRAIRYFDASATIFAEQGDVGREVTARRRVANCHYSLERYQTALEGFQSALTLAERHDLPNARAEILIDLVRTHYMRGELDRVVSVFFQLFSVCQQQKDMRAVSQILQPAVEAYLELGRTREALSFVEEFQRLSPPGEGEALGREGAMCEFLLAKVFQQDGNPSKAREHYDAAYKAIAHLLMHGLKIRELFQAHQLDGVTIFEPEIGPAAAFAKIEELLSQEIFKGAFLHYAYFEALHLAAWADNREGVERYLIWCMQNEKRMPPTIRLRLAADLGKYYLDFKSLERAQQALRTGASSMGLVIGPLARARFQDQMARLASEQGDRTRALRTWQIADDEFAGYLQNLSMEGRKAFQERTAEWREHRILGLMLQSIAEA